GRAVELAKKAVALDPRASYWNTLGVAQYRAGNFKDALVALEKSMVRSTGKIGNSFDWFFVAMAHWQLGNEDKARTGNEKAATWMDKNNPRDEELRCFRAEAEQLMKVN